MKNLTIVIPSYNNLDYLKLCYSSIRKSDALIPLIIFDDASTDNTFEWLNSLDDDNLTIHRLERRTGHTILYDVGFREATTEYVGILHSDMVVSNNFLPNLYNKLSPNKVISATCVEPPLHPDGAEKIVKDFGMYPHHFDSQRFNEWANDAVQNNITLALFAPWFVSKAAYFEKLGGHDLQYAPYGYEDADLFVRMKKAGFQIEQRRDLLLYHFTQRGHRWNNGEVGRYNDDYVLQMHITKNRFLTKWGTLGWKDEQHHPVDIPLYYKRLKIKNYSNVDARNRYEIINLFFNEVVTDTNYPIKTSDNSISPNYEVVLDYNVNYNMEDLINFMSQLPFLVREQTEGIYEVSEMTLNILNIDELSLTKE
jgi:GT2 family glycosyltransferase